MNTYGILDSNDCHIDVSNTEKGAKNYATRHGYKKVSVRYGDSFNVALIAVRSNSGKWMHADWVPTRETVYRCMIGKVVKFESTDSLAAYAYLNTHRVNYNYSSMLVKTGWRSINSD